MNIRMTSRLSVMMFLQYGIWGSWYVTLGTWLATALKFSGQQIGWAAGTTAIGAMLSPFFIGVVADRFVSTQKLLAILHLIGAVLLWLGSMQHSFGSLYVTLLMYAICFMPTLALTNALTFRQLASTQNEFGLIRVFGTIGWIAAGLIVGTLGLEATRLPMQFAAILSALLAAYCLTLPETPPLARGTDFSWSQIIPPGVIQTLRSRSMATFCGASLLICIPLQFYYAFTNLYLNEIGIHNAAGKMTAGQASELLCMLLIPWFFRRMGVKYMLALAMLFWVVRYTLFAYGNADDLMWMIWTGIVLHGICFDFFFVVGQIYIDRKSPAVLRAATQGLITFLTYGVGMFIGSWLSGLVVDGYVAGPGAIVAHDWQSIWIVAATFAAVVLIVFLFAFCEDSDRRA